MRDCAASRYDKANRRMVGLMLNRKYDGDILSWLEIQENKQAYIKSLIRNDMAASAAKKEEKR